MEEKIRTKHFVIIVPPCDFWQYTRRFHYEALSKFAEVTIIPFPISFHKGIVNYRKLRRADYKEKTLHIIRNTLGLPEKLYLRSKFFSKIERWLLKRLLYRYLRKDSIIILTNVAEYEWGPFWDIISSHTIIYELTDAPWLDIVAKDKVKRLVNLCPVLLQANLIFCSSINLTKFAKHLNKNVFYIPNTTKIPTNVFYRLPKNTIVFGFIGNINDWINLDLIEELSKALDKAVIVFVGEINGTKKFSQRFNTLVKERLITHIQKVPIESIFVEIQKFDVGIIPYRINHPNLYVYPNKLIQYVSCGKPVITTNFAPDLVFFKKYIYIANTREEFIAFANKFLNGTINITEKIFKELRDIAIKNSADERAKLRLKYLELYESNK